ncbi:MAG: hypothetical protein HY244_16795 [Rhizobiales bacterium]|nr:hypothetical protein [Hyphomicrobiales bacterium]
MSLQRYLSAAILGLCCVTIASSALLHPALAEIPAEYLVKVQARIERLFDNGNIYAVQNRPTRETTFTLSRPIHLTKIMTYHWNDGRGAPAGTIGLRDGAGEIYGPWEAVGQPGQGGVPSAYWIVEGDLELPAGTYTFLDSDPSTWSQNAGSRGAGMVIMEGYRD